MLMSGKHTASVGKIICTSIIYYIYVYIPSVLSRSGFVTVLLAPEPGCLEEV